MFRAAKELAAFTYPRSAKTRLFTHPIFESDFDCLTGKNRLHALSLLSPLASYKLKKFTKKICIFYIMHLYLISALWRWPKERVKGPPFKLKINIKNAAIFGHLNYLKMHKNRCIFFYFEYKRRLFDSLLRLASYRLEWTSSRPITEVKLGRARLVLTWVTGWEYLVR